jgi:hypothetical protein
VKRFGPLAASCLCLALSGYGVLLGYRQHQAHTWHAWFEAREVPEFQLSLDASARSALLAHPRQPVRAVFEHDGQRLCSRTTSLASSETWALTRTARR